MASDLSIQLQEAITSTIETSLSNGNDVSVLKTYKITNQALNGLNVLVVNVSFVFEKLTTNFKFVLPARTATMIAHAMLMEDTPPLDTISEDIADAMKESITQICGTLQTVINSSDLEDLGKSSFSIGEYEIIDGSDYTVNNSFIFFKLSCGEDLYPYYIDFEENFLPFIEEIANSDIFVFEEEQVKVDAPDNDVEETTETNDEDYVPPIDSNVDTKEQNNKEISEEESKSNTSDNEGIDGVSEIVKEDENIVEEVAEEDDQLAKANKKNKIIKIIVIALAVILAIVIIGFSAMLYMGMFDKEEVPLEKPKVDVNITKPSEESLIMAEIKNKQIDFKMNMIDEDRLNKKLQFLTKYEILEEDVLEKYKKAEADRLYKLKMEKLEEFALNNKEESLYKSSDGNLSVNNTQQRKNRFDEDINGSSSLNAEESQKMMDNEILMLIRIDPKEYKKYKDIITTHKQDSTQISICKDQRGVVNVYVGPLYLKTVINTILNEAKKLDKNSKKDMELVSIKRGEFNKMCDF